MISEKHFSYCVSLSVPEMMFIYEPELPKQTLPPDDNDLNCRLRFPCRQPVLEWRAFSLMCILVASCGLSIQVLPCLTFSL